MKLIILLFLMILVSCGSKQQSTDDNQYTCKDSMLELDGRKTILVVGDSISWGYTPHLQSSLPDYQVIHNECNGRNSRYGRDNINLWLSHSNYWDICILNHGVWDTMIDTIYYTSFSEYKDNINYEINKLKERCLKVIIPNVTRIPDNVYHFDYMKVDTLNEILKELTNKLDVKYCNLNRVSKKIKHLHVNTDLQNDVHFTEQGYRILANKVLKCSKILE